jgi:hypothetical protein
LSNIKKLFPSCEIELCNILEEKKIKWKDP